MAVDAAPPHRQRVAAYALLTRGDQVLLTRMSSRTRIKGRWTLPGFGDEKAKIFLAVLAKRCGVAPPGWAECALPFSDGNPRSVADIDGPEALLRVRSWKKQQKAMGKGKQD